MRWGPETASTILPGLQLRVCARAAPGHAMPALPSGCGDPVVWPCPCPLAVLESSRMGTSLVVNMVLEENASEGQNLN